MSKQGPSLRCHRDGGAVAKISGRVLRFGRFDDPEAHARFAALKSAWLRAGRLLTDDVLAAGGKGPLRRRRASSTGV